MMECTLDSSVADWVIEHPETFAVFQNLGIDYCCGGRSLKYACQEQDLSEQFVLSKLRATIDGTETHSNPTPST